MFRLSCLVVMIGTVLAVNVEEIAEKCAKPFMAKKMCCKSLTTELPFDLKNNLKECMQLPGSPSLCDREICVATKSGTGTADGKLVMDKLQEEMNTIFGSEPQLLSAIEKECVDGDLNRFGNADTCEIKKYKHCLELQLLKSCSDWSSESDCEGVKQSAEDCIKLFN